jgi:hypothetical protein
MKDKMLCLGTIAVFLLALTPSAQGQSTADFILGTQPPAAPAGVLPVDVCIDAADFRLDDVDGDGAFSAGDGATGVGIIVPGGTIPDDGVGVASCSAIASLRIGTFFARGRVVAGLPSAEPDDIAYVDWQFRIDGQGAIDTTGPVKASSPYPQTIVGATGNLAGLSGEALTQVLDASGFQLRLLAP